MYSDCNTHHFVISINSKGILTWPIRDEWRWRWHFCVWNREPWIVWSYWELLCWLDKDRVLQESLHPRPRRSCRLIPKNWTDWPPRQGLWTTQEDLWPTTVEQWRWLRKSPETKTRNYVDDYYCSQIKYVKTLHNLLSFGQMWLCCNEQLWETCRHCWLSKTNPQPHQCLAVKVNNYLKKYILLNPFLVQFV